MEEGGNNKRVLDLFTKGSHHRNITVLYLCQHIFPPGMYAKSISRNAHYVIAFKKPWDQLGVRNVMIQFFPTPLRANRKTYEDVPQRPYGYLIMGFHPDSDDHYRLLSHVLKDEGWTRTYIIYFILFYYLRQLNVKYA